MSAIFYKNLPYGAGGSNVEANPSGSASADLEKIGIDGTVYDVTDADAVHSSDKGVANGVASLDATGRVPSTQLPSYVDDVLEYASLSAFPATGESGKIYIALDTNKTYRWSGSAYIEISESLALGETTGTAYEGSKGKANADNIASLQTSVGKAYLTDDSAETDIQDADYIPFYDTSATSKKKSLWSNIKAKLKAYFDTLYDKTPTLATVATSGSYNDLSNKPTIPTVNNKTLTIQKNGTQVAQFTANSSSDVTANITVPTGDLASVNKPSSGQTTSYLRGDGTWQNFPSIPAAQVQSDWNQTDTSAVDYIKNKPTISDTKVTQNNTTTNSDRRVLLSASANDTNETNTARKSGNLTFNPSTGNLQAVQLNGVTIGSSPKFTDNDTKNTAGTTNTTSKIYLAGATSQAANPQTYSNVNCYASGGKLYSNGTEVLTLAGGTMTGTIVTPDTGGIEPKTDQLSNIGSSSKYYNSAYVTNMYVRKPNVGGMFRIYDGYSNNGIELRPELGLSANKVLTLPGETGTLATHESLGAKSDDKTSSPWQAFSRTHRLGGKNIIFLTANTTSQIAVSNSYGSWYYYTAAIPIPTNSGWNYNKDAMVFGLTVKNTSGGLFAANIRGNVTSTELPIYISSSRSESAKHYTISAILVCDAS